MVTVAGGEPSDDRVAPPCGRFKRQHHNPGEGGMALPPDLPISLEVPTATLARAVPAAERARRALDAARAVLATA